MSCSVSGRVLVTGGARFKGVESREGPRRGWVPRYLSRQLHVWLSEQSSVFPGVRVVQGDVRDGQAVEEVIRGTEVVFPLAASVGDKRSIDDPTTDAEVNVLGTLRVIEAVRKHGVRKIVASSSASVFGELKAPPLREDQPF